MGFEIVAAMHIVFVHACMHFAVVHDIIGMIRRT